MKTIERGEVLRLAGDRATEIEVQDGCVWVTQERDGEDYILTKGGRLRLQRPGIAVISALKAALIDLKPVAA